MASRSVSARESDPDFAAMHRVRLRLAALTVGMLLALVTMISTVVYFRAQSLMQQSLRDLVRAGAEQQVSQFRDAFDPKERDQSARPVPEVDEQTSGVFIVFMAGDGTYLGGDARQFGTTVPDRSAAMQALRSGNSLFDIAPFKSERYLFYSLPVAIGGQVEGVIQAAASTRQYDQSMRDLLEVLLSVSVFGLVASAGITLLLVSKALAPIRRSLTRQREFVADAAHELRTPLTVLRSAAELGLASSQPLEQDIALAQALTESRHLARLVDDLALLARADSGAQTLTLEPVELSQMTSETVKALAMLAEDRNIAVHLQIEADVRVQGDFGRLRQLLFILMDNALKHTPDGGEITVRVDRAGNRARLQVQDSGPGIAAADLPHIFDRFYRARNQRDMEGAGLGLAIAQWIVHAHRGQITAANTEPHGAVFTALIPALDEGA